ncbi:MAG: VWA domain-containing protein [Campylobacterota bacterium]|nr:VWA domain-containing protein [Campylobacterota bacterium]
MQKILLSTLFLWILQATLYAQNSPQVMLILDASGSMWGQIEGRDKITIAKETLVNNISNWKEDVNLGLIVFGHNNLERCKGSEIIMPLGLFDESQMLKKLKAINPKAQGSLAHALKNAAKALENNDKKATLLLISDGQDACRVNPCNTARIMAERGLDFKVHVIGFDVYDKEAEQLRCIADITGGKYLFASNAEEFNHAFNKLVEKIQSEKDRPSREYRHRSKSAGLINERDIEVTARKLNKIDVYMGVMAKIEIIARVRNDEVKTLHTIYEQDTSKRIASCWSEKGKSCIRALPEGKYRVISVHNNFEKENHFELKESESSRLRVRFSSTDN